MSFKTVLAVMLVLVLAASGIIQAQDTEQDIVNKYLTKAKKMHTKKLGWMSVNFAYNNIENQNDYNKMINQLRTQIPGSQFQWLSRAASFGLEFGTIFQEKWGWSVSGEYWLKAGKSFSGSFAYTPPSGTTVMITDPQSEVSVWGVTTGMQYYVYNKPDMIQHLTGLAIRTGFSVGYYVATWDLFDQYQNVNLQTATSEDQNISYKGSAPGFNLRVGADYPLKVLNLSLGADASYMFLNFKNMAWYNAQDQEIVASIDGTEEGRVDLDLSGLRAKVELKRFFSW